MIITQKFIQVSQQDIIHVTSLLILMQMATQQRGDFKGREGASVNMAHADTDLGFSEHYVCV
jgi:hypothetical protein